VSESESPERDSSAAGGRAKGYLSPGSGDNRSGRSFLAGTAGPSSSTSVSSMISSFSFSKPIRTSPIHLPLSQKPSKSQDGLVKSSSAAPRFHFVVAGHQKARLVPPLAGEFIAELSF
jgi:hypothetical protein